MRTFEILLIVVNVLSLFLSFRKQSKAVRLGIAGINLSVFLVHALAEGFRYQMVFSYMFVVLFAVYTVVKTSSRFFKAGFPKVLRVIVITLSLVLLVFTSFLAYALPVFAFPKPTGSYDVGIKYFHLVDEKRNEPFLEKATQKRELMVKVYYPAKKDATKPFSPYFHNSPELLRLFVEANGLPNFVFDHLNLVQTHSKEDLELSDQQQSYPVLLFSHGAGTTMEVHTSQCEDLASNGYIVVAIDHTYASAATAFPDRIVSAREATTLFDSPEPAEIIAQILTDDAQFVIDKLFEMNEGKMDSLFKGKLNLHQLGAIGHSLGGAIAYDLAINDKRVKAAINLDGSVYITPKEDVKNMAPFLMLANDEYGIQAIQNQEPLMQKFDDMTADQQKIYGSKERYNEFYEKAKQNEIGLHQVLKSFGNVYAIEGSAHMKFADVGLFIGNSQLRELIGIHGKTDPAKCLEITEAVTLAFFDHHLKGENKDVLEALVQEYPELKKVDLK